MQPAWGSLRMPCARFQSSSSPKTGCNDSIGCNDWRCSCFNPHPARRPDATQIGSSATISWLKCFNPHPARRPDATSMDARMSSCPLLFQSSSSPKAGCNRPQPRFAAFEFGVSILIQPEGRMQPPTKFNCTLPSWFQSSSSPKAGCNRVREGIRSYSPKFQSSSSPKAGCNWLSLTYLPSPRDWFQSSSSPKAGCNWLSLTYLPSPRDWFQSSSSPKAGCNEARNGVAT